MKTKNLYPIRYVSRRTGLSTHVIRTWEKRYGAIKPERSDTQRRLFCESDIKRLQLLAEAVNRGHSISQIAGLNTEEIMKLINVEVAPQSGIEKIPASNQHYKKVALEAVLELDPSGLESTLSQAAIELTRTELIRHVIVPLTASIGERWMLGELKIVNEHMATTIIRAFLWDLLRSNDICETTPRILITTPMGQRHELGALTAALIAAESGWRALYFGPSLPAEEIVEAVARVQAHAVALSITHLLNGQRLILELQRLRRFLAEDIPIFIGGIGARLLGNAVGAKGIMLTETDEQFRRALDGLTLSPNEENSKP
jgi:DNA-binding transcriptional MerR regulator/methylmalonyl-CoA mutase cobalamin-binding subunit